MNAYRSRFKSRIVFGLFFVLALCLTTLSPALAYTPVAVYGQADFTSNGVNRGGAASAETLNVPLALTTDADGGLYVADRNNHRVLYYAADGDTVADRVYGQYGDFSAHIANNDGNGNSGIASADNMAMPTAVAVDSQGGLYVTDRENHRVLYFANDGDTTADRVYGQYGNFNANMTNNDSTGNYGEPSADGFGTYILGIATDAQDGIYVSDSSNHRVLYFANDGDTTADRVYGQSDNFNTGVRNNDGTGRIGAPSANSLNFPRGLIVDSSGGLYVADRDNNRVLYFANDGDTTADRVYGQFGSFTTNAESNDGSGGTGTPSADNLSHPKSVAIGTQGGLYIADTLHSRILFFADPAQTTATGVGGQGMSMESGAPNAGGSAPTMDTFQEPQGIAIAPNGMIYVSDTGNNRIIAIECPEWEGE